MALRDGVQNVLVADLADFVMKRSQSSWYCHIGFDCQALTVQIDLNKQDIFSDCAFLE